MLRQYRIERANGQEYVIQETYRLYTWTKEQNDKFSQLVEGLTSVQEIEDVRLKFREDEQIPIYSQIPCCIIRVYLFSGKPVEWYLSLDPSEVPVFGISELNKFISIFDGHWRNMIACQRDRYGELFGTTDD